MVNMICYMGLLTFSSMLHSENMADANEGGRGDGGGGDGGDGGEGRTRRSLLWGKASHAARVGMLDDDDDDDYGDNRDEYVN